MSLKLASDSAPSPQPAPDVKTSIEEVVDTAASPESAPEEPEAAPESAKVEPKAEPLQVTSKQFAALTRKEKQLRQREAEIADRERKAADVEKRYANAQQTDDALRAEARANPEAFMQKYGLSYQQLTDYMILKKPIEPEVKDPVAELEKKWAERFSKLETDNKALVDKLAAREQDEQNVRVSEGEKAIQDGILAASKDFEIISGLGAYGQTLVRNAVQEYWDQHEEILDYGKACGIVEQYLEAELLPGILATNKVKSRFAAPAAPKQETKPAKSVAPASETLTNDEAAVAPALPSLKDIPVWDSEARVNALLRKWEYQESLKK